MKKPLLFMACVGICACVLAACTRGKTEVPGDELTAAEIEVYRQKLLAEQEAQRAEEVSSEPEMAPEKETETDVCYYTAVGTVWHADRGCSYLKRSKEVLEGSISGAAIAGKQRPCSSCASMYIQE